MNKKEILERLESERERFLDALEGLGETELEQPGVAGTWSIKDILIHISHWEAELVKLLFQASHGQKPTSIHFSKVDVDQTNQEWIEESHARPLRLVLDDFHGVRNQTILRVESFSERDLSDPNRYKWTNGHPLAEWIATDSFEHEAEHYEQILAWRKNQQI